jgi:hypothetical protein
MAVQNAQPYGWEATNKKQGGLSARGLPPPISILLVALQSYMPPRWLEYTKTPPQTGGCSFTKAPTQKGG